MSQIKLNEITWQKALYDAVEKLKNGGIIAFPTETYYGLGAKFDIEESLKKIYAMKNRPEEKALPLIIGEKGLLSDLVTKINSMANLLMDAYWPGPLTLIFPAKENLSEYITAGTHKVAVRIPGESFALALAEASGFPITATSANLSGLPPAMDADTILKYFGDEIDLIIDGGPAPGGLPSTIVDVTGDNMIVLREGAIRKEFLTSISVRS